MNLTVKETFEILKNEGITTHIETVRKWIRQGDLKAYSTGSKKSGYLINEEDLKDFIAFRKPVHSIKVSDEYVNMIVKLSVGIIIKSTMNILSESKEELKSKDVDSVLEYIDTREFKKRVDVSINKRINFIFTLTTEQLKDFYEINKGFN